MTNSLFSCQPTLASYERAEIIKEFTQLAQATRGKLNPLAIRLNRTRQVIIADLRWRQFRGEVVLQRSWTVLVSLHLYLPKTMAGRVRLSNVYGEASGTPLMGPLRLESNWPQERLERLFSPPIYQLVYKTAEPYTLFLEAYQIYLITYRFYTNSFYIRAYSFLAQLAQRAIELNPPPSSLVRPQQVQLPGQ